MKKVNTLTETRPEEAIKKSRMSPPRYKVLMHNDDYTTMDFVVDVLEQVFRKSTPEASRIMLNIHVEGVGLCGIFSYEIAETKVARVHELAKKSGFPLKCSFEAE